MLAANHILLASHGTEGALAAERMTMEVAREGAAIHHLLVVPGFWEGMTGDDWLNNGITRDRYRRYLESELGREVDEHIARVRARSETRGITYNSEIVLGEPDQCLLQVSREGAYDLLIMGSPRPKGKKGLRSRMATEKLTRFLPLPILIVPYPDE